MGDNNDDELKDEAIKNKAEDLVGNGMKKLAIMMKKIIKKFISIIITKGLVVIMLIAIIVGLVWLVAKKSIVNKVIDAITSMDFSISVYPDSEDYEQRTTKTVDFTLATTIEGDDTNGYYIKVSSTVIEELENKLTDQGLKPSDLGLTSFTSLREFIEAEIVTQMPDLKNTNVEYNGKDIITNGCIKIERTIPQDDGSNKIIQLSYTTPEKFESYKSKYQNNNDDTVLNYFTINENNEVVVATISKTEITVTTAEGSDTSIAPSIPESSSEYTVTETVIPYKNITSKYSMPFMFFISILGTVNSENLTTDLVALAKDTDMTITIEDNIQITDSTEEDTYIQKYEGYKEFDYKIFEVHQYKNNVTTQIVEEESNHQVTASPNTKTCEFKIKTHTETDTPNVELTYVKSWIAIAEIEYSYSTDNKTTSNTYGPEEERTPADKNDFDINTDADISKYISGRVSYWTNNKILPSDAESNEDYVRTTVTSERSNLDVSGLKLVNTTTIKTNTTVNTKKITSTKKEITSNEEEIFAIFDKNKSTVGKLYNARKLFYSFLEENTNTASIVDIMTYLLEKYKDPNYEGELDLSAFDIDDFSSSNTNTNFYSLIKEYIHSWEGQPQEEGDYYIIFDDGAKNPTVGWGISINTSGYKQKFIAAGYSTAIGGKVPKEFVDAIEDEILQSKIDQVNSLNLNLTSYQIAALVCRSYNYNISGFKTNYNNYWDENKNEEYYGYNGSDIYEHQLYTNYMNKPVTSSGKVLSGLVSRRNSEWLLFMTGYCDKLDMMWPLATDTTKMTNGISYYDSVGNVSEEAVNKINEYLTKDLLNTTIHYKDSANQGGPFAKWWQSGITALSKFQCTWWANNRADQYLEFYGTKYTKYPTESGNGGEYYAKNVQGKWFKYGQEPRANSIISWKNGSYGHVAYVEAVDSTGIWISHAGSGKSWFGIQKISLDGSIWSGYTLNGYIYLDEPL